jgi:hypothetical protein
MEPGRFSVGDDGRGKYDAMLVVVGGDESGLASGEVCLVWRQDE